MQIGCILNVYSDSVHLKILYLYTLVLDKIKITHQSNVLHRKSSKKWFVFEHFLYFFWINVCWLGAQADDTRCRNPKVLK